MPGLIDPNKRRFTYTERKETYKALNVISKHRDCAIADLVREATLNSAIAFAIRRPDLKLVVPSPPIAVTPRISEGKDLAKIPGDSVRFTYGEWREVFDVLMAMAADQRLDVSDIIRNATFGLVAAISSRFPKLKISLPLPTTKIRA